MAKGLLRYILMLLIFFLLGLLYDSYQVFVLLITFALAGVAMFFIWMVVARKVKLEAYVEEEIVSKGENIELTIKLKNRSSIPVPNVFVELHIANEYDGDTTVQEFYLQGAGRNACGTTIVLTSEYCGNIHISFGKIYIFDAFGIFRHKAISPKEIVVAVIPKPQEVTERLEGVVKLLGEESHEYSNEKSGDDVSEIFDIREYRQGDSYKRVHRKLSMKMDDLLVKECGLPVDCSLKIMLDFKRKTTTKESLQSFDDIICEMVSLGEALVDRRIPFFVIWYDNGSGVCRKERVDTREDLYEVISLLYKNSPCSEEADLIRRYEATFPLDSTATVVIVDGDKNGEES